MHKVHRVVVCLLLVVSSFASAQQLSHPVMASRDDAFSNPRAFRFAADTIDVLAVMVQFQVDSDARTNGNGQFDLSTPSARGLDSPPHDRQYFLDHLTFLSNYYRKASKGKAIVRATLVDTIYTLSSRMERYSPPRNGSNIVVGDLARDTWLKVDSSGKVQDFSRYDCFVVFHAGVGRDVDVTSTIGFDPTPLDIPSLYLGLNAFKEFYGANFDGIPVRNGFKIPNTIIMPETETRELPATPSNVLLRLGINGLLCASVGNFLGLPDLFDTNTGRSGIGRFGLMDGQAIFSFAGAFPPEPSAWEKYWLGWIQPITLSTGTSNIALPAASLDSARVYRVPISASEYFLIENRNRDAAQNGQRVTTSYAGTIRTQTFARDTTGFEAFDLAQISGNIIDVEDLDWSLPGGVSRSGVSFDGGMLIWHIDENVIAQGLATNGVNANPDFRGVDVEEADGSQDIGQQYGQLEPGSGSEEGTALDFWYRGNESPVNRNEFSSVTYPSSASNGGANSLVTIKEFSARGPLMTAVVTIGGNVALIPGFPKSMSNKPEAVSLTVADLGGAYGPSIIVTSNAERSTVPQRTISTMPSKIYAWKIADGNGVLRSDGEFASVASAGSSFLNSVAVRDLNNDGVPELVTGELFQGTVPTSAVRAFSARPQTIDGLAVPYFSRNVNEPVTTAPVITDSIIAVGGENGRLYALRFDGTVIDSVRKVSGDVVGVSRTSNANTLLLTTNEGTIAIKPNSGTTSAEVSQNVGKSLAGPGASGIVTSDEMIVASTADGFLYLFERNLALVPGFPINTGATILHSPVLADLDGDGKRDIIAFSGNRIHAYNYAGASLDNYPKLVLASAPIASNPVVADVDDDGDVDVVAVTRDGIVVAFDKNGTMAGGFPLQAGRGNQSVAAFAFPAGPLSVTNVGLAVASSEDGSVTAWKTAAVGGNRQPLIPWAQHQRDAQHSGLALEQIAGTPISTAFFPKDRAYNWPNPVYDGRTFIRYFVSENVSVKIKIFDLAGDLVKELSGPGIGGVDNEVEWSIADVQSGVYLARIEASGSGKTESAIVKVAVVK